MSFISLIEDFESAEHEFEFYLIEIKLAFKVIEKLIICKPLQIWSWLSMCK